MVDLACGSLHCVVCTEDGKAFTWGDNDEGQIGNDTTVACREPHVSSCSRFSFGDSSFRDLRKTRKDTTPLLYLCMPFLQELRIPDEVHIDHVTCGSAHSVAWSSIRRKIVCQLPDKVPMEFNHLQGISMPVLRNRLILLHQFSHLFCKSLALFGVHDGTFEGFEKLRCILLSNAKVNSAYNFVL